MPYAVTHILLTIVLLEIIREYFLKDKRNFPHYFIIIGGIAGLLPDIDMILFYIMHALFQTPMESIHRIFTHSVVWPALLLIGAYYAYFKGNKKATNLLIVITIGFTFHLLLDAITGVIMPLAPFTYQAFGLNLVPGSGYGAAITVGIDAVILIAWLIHEEFRHKISRYI